MKTRMVIQELLDAHEPTWSSIHLAAALKDEGFDVSPLSVGRWVSGNTQPRGVPLIAAIARILDVSVDDLFVVDEETDGAVAS